MAVKSSEPLVLEAPWKHTAAVIWLHGLGDTGEGWRGHMTALQAQLPYIKFVLPHAPMRAWHKNRDENGVSKGANESRTLVETLIRAQIADGVPADRIAVGGYSQGAAMALFTGYQYSSRLAGIVVLSGYLLSDCEDLTITANKETPSLICHGDADKQVSCKAGERAFKQLQALKIPSVFHAYKNLPHAVCPEEMHDVLSFLSRQLPFVWPAVAVGPTIATSGATAASVAHNHESKQQQQPTPAPGAQALPATQSALFAVPNGIGSVSGTGTGAGAGARGSIAGKSEPNRHATKTDKTPD